MYAVDGDVAPGVRGSRLAAARRPQNPLSAGKTQPLGIIRSGSGDFLRQPQVNILHRDNKIHLEFSDTPVYNSAYIEGVANLYEFDVGNLSGWMYQVNGWFPNYGCSRYQLKDGDVVEWVYTCDLGNDVGGGYAAESE